MSQSMFLTPLVVVGVMPIEIDCGDAELWILREALTYRSELFGDIVVPAGYTTDFASIPSLFKNYMDDDSPGILYPSVVHDWLYTHGGQLPDGRAYSRELADNILREAMEATGHSRIDQRAVVYRIVRLFGGSHWKPVRG